MEIQLLLMFTFCQARIHRGSLVCLIVNILDLTSFEITHENCIWCFVWLAWEKEEGRMREKMVLHNPLTVFATGGKNALQKSKYGVIILLSDF